MELYGDQTESFVLIFFFSCGHPLRRIRHQIIDILTDINRIPITTNIEHEQTSTIFNKINLCTLSQSLMKKIYIYFSILYILIVFLLKIYMVLLSGAMDDASKNDLLWKLQEISLHGLRSITKAEMRHAERFL